MSCQINRRTLAAKADLTHVVVGFEDGTTELWNRHNVSSAGDDDGATTAGPELGPLAGHTDLVKSVDLSSNLLVSGSWDGGIRLWLRTRQKGREAGVCLGSSYHHQGGNSMALKMLVYFGPFWGIFRTFVGHFWFIQLFSQCKNTYYILLNLTLGSS